MDTGEMRELLQGYFDELEWGGGVTKDDLLGHLAGRDDALRTMINEYVTEGTYRNQDEVLNLLPAQGWQDAQGDTWRGSTNDLPEDVDSGFERGAVGQQDAGGTGNAPFGDAGSNAGEVDPGIAGDVGISSPS